MIRVVWLTNYAAPYRFPIWAQLNERCDLQVVVRRTHDPLRAWAAATGVHVGLAPKSRGLFRLVRRADAVVLGGWEPTRLLWITLLAGWSGAAGTVLFYESHAASHRYHRGLRAAVRRWTLRRMKVVLCAGPAARRAALQAGVSADRLLECMNGVDIDVFAAAAESSPMSDAHEFLFVGRLFDRKNVHAVMAALAQIEGARLTIVGDGPVRTYLEDLSAFLGLSDRVCFLGSLSEARVVELLAATHCLVLASRREVWGLVVNEALAAGRHVVVSDAAGVSEVVVNQPGVFVFEGNGQSLVEAMRASQASWSGPVLGREAMSARDMIPAVLTAVHRAAWSRQETLLQGEFS